MQSNMHTVRYQQKHVVTPRIAKNNIKTVSCCGKPEKHVEIITFVYMCVARTSYKMISKPVALCVIISWS